MTDWDAEDYVAHSAAQQIWARELIEKLHLRGDEAVLDIGCGDGRATAMIAERLPEGSVLGVDRSPNMIAMAQAQFPLGDHPNLRFRQMDARHIELPPAFDVAFSTAALHWVDDHEAVLGGVRRSLKPAGRLLFQMGGRGNLAAACEVGEEIVARPRWRGYFTGFSSPYHFYTPEDYEVLLPQAGLRVTRVEFFAKDMPHVGRGAFLGWLRTTWIAYTERLPAELRDAFCDDVADAYAAVRLPDAEGVIHVKMMRLEVEAEVACRDRRRDWTRLRLTPVLLTTQKSAPCSGIVAAVTMGGDCCHSRPSSSRPPACWPRPPQPLKVNATPAARQRSRNPRSQSGCGGLRPGPDSPPAITRSMAVRSSASSGPRSGSAEIWRTAAGTRRRASARAAYRPLSTVTPIHTLAGHGSEGASASSRSGLLVST